jgi:hypothetical protein
VHRTGALAPAAEMGGGGYRYCDIPSGARNLLSLMRDRRFLAPLGMTALGAE